MAVIKLTIQPDKASLESTIKTINESLNQIKGINIKIDSGAAKATQSIAANLQGVSKAADGAAKTIKKTETAIDGVIKKQTELTQVAVGEYEQLVKAKGKETKTFIHNEEEKRKAAQKTADEAEKRRVAEYQAAEQHRQDQIKREMQATAEVEDAKVKQAQEANRQMVKDEEEALRQRSAAWKSYFDKLNEENAAQEKANAAREKAVESATSLERQYSNLIRQIDNLKKMYPEGTFDDIETQAREAREELRNLDKTSEDYADKVKLLQGNYQGLQRDMANTREETNKLDKVTESFWLNIQKFARWYIGGNFVVKIVNSLREALKTMKEVDTELANIQKVTDRTDAEMQKLAKSAYSAASAYGVSAQAYLESAAEFAKAGFGDQAEELAEVAIKTQLVGDVSADVADKFLIASNAAWKMNGNIDQLNKTLDAANIIENNYATSIEKLAAGMPIAASVAANAGMTFEQTIAALGTITSVTQETGTKAATALRALILNIIGAVGEYEDGIEVTEESVKSLDGILQVYAKDALEAAAAAGTVVNPMEAIAALAKASEEGLVNQAELFEILSSLGGKLRTNQLISLVQNYGTYLEMLDKTKESAGSADKEIGIMLDTWEAKTNILKNTWTEFISKTVETDAIKFFLDLATALVKFADNAGLAAMAAAGLVTIFKGKEIVGGIKDVINLFKNLGTALQGATLNMTAATTALGLMTAALSIGIMVYKSIQQARAEATQKAVSEGKEIKELADKYDGLVKQIGSEELSREDLQDILKKNVDKYNEEYDSIKNVNELREIGIDLINEETKAKAKQYTLENAGAYRRAERYLSDSNAVTVADMGGVSITMGAREAQAFLEKQIENAQKVENPTRAQIAALETLTQKYKEVSQAIEDSEGIIEAYTTAEALLNGTYEKTEEAISGVEGQLDKLNGKQNDAANSTKTLHELLQEASDAATAYDTAIGGVVDAMADFGAGSVEVYDAMKKLEETIPGSTDKLYDFDTATIITQEDIWGSKEAILDFIDTTKQLEFSQQISQLEELAASYWDVAGAALAAMNAQASEQMAGVLSFTTSPFMSQSGLDNINNQLEALKGKQAEWNAYVSTLRTRSGYSGAYGSGSGGSTRTAADTATGSSTDYELERLKAIISLEKQELSFLQASGKSLDEINAKRKDIQAALHDEAEYLRAQLEILKAQEVAEEDKAEHEAKIKALEEEILGLSTEWWNIQKNINDDLAKAEEERLKQLEEEAKLLEAQRKLQQEMFDNLKQTVDDYYDKLISDKEEELSLEEKILAVQKAEAALANAQRERNVRYYNASTGQWEWQANAKNVKSAQDALKKAQDDLTKYQRDQAWKAFKSAWEYVAKQIRSGAITFEEAYDYMYKEMKRIQDTYGVDLGQTLEDSIGGFKDLNYGIDGLTQEVADTLGKSVGVLDEKLKQYETAVGALKKAFDEASENVENGEWSMDKAYSYLRDRAKDIADKYGIDMTGALNEAIKGMDKTNMSIDELWKAVIINLMKVNSARWFDANDEEKALLHAQNMYLGNLIGATYDPSGYWYLNGSQLYGSQKGVAYDSTGYGNETGGGGGGGGAGGGAESGSAGGEDHGVGAKQDANGNWVYYDSYGNTYDTLEAAVLGNAAIAAARNAHKGTLYYGEDFLTQTSDPSIRGNKEKWQARSGLSEADPAYAAQLDAFFAELDSGVPLDQLNKQYSNLYGGGTFASYEGKNGTTGFVSVGDGIGTYALIRGDQVVEKTTPGTQMQDYNGNRYVVGDDGHSLIPLLPAWYENEDGTTTPGYVYTMTGKVGEDIDRGRDGIVKAKSVISAEDIAKGEEWAAMMNLGNNDLTLAGADAMSDTATLAPSPLEKTSIVNNGNTYQMGGISIGDEAAKTTTVYELARLAGMLGQYNGK